MKKSLKVTLAHLCSYIFSVFLITACVLASFFPLSCKMTEEGIEIVSTDTSAPEILDFSQLDSSTLSLSCSEVVELSQVYYAPKGEEVESPEENVSISYGEDKTSATLSLLEGSQIGEKYLLYGSISDASGNSLLFELPFTGYNDHVARLVLTEVRTETSSNNGKYPEFVELYCLKSGNTAGLELLSAKKGEDDTYLFPTMEVEAGEYITVHFMKASEGDCIDEMEDDLSLSTATDSSPYSRDLWLDNESSYLTKSDVLILRNVVSNSIIDGLQYSEKGTAWSTKVAVYASQIYDGGIWTQGSDVSYAVSSNGATGKRTLNRLNLADIIAAFSQDQADDPIPVLSSHWQLCTSPSPGQENSSDLYTK